MRCAYSAACAGMTRSTEVAAAPMVNDLRTSRRVMFGLILFASTPGTGHCGQKPRTWLSSAGLRGSIAWLRLADRRPTGPAYRFPCFACSSKYSDARHDSAMIVRVVFLSGLLTNDAASVTKRFFTSWAWQ